MRIPLKILENKIQINSVLRCAGFRLYGQVLFVVDTGSPLTLLSEGDALRLKVPIKKLRRPPNEKEHIYMGGSVLELKIIPKETILAFKNDKDEAENVSLPSLCVTLATKKGDKHKVMSQGSPSILGMDFLADNGLLLYVNPKKDIAYLEKEEAE